MAQINAYIPVQDLANDLVVQAGNQQFNPAIPISALLSPNTMFSIQKNSDGEDKLCIIKGDDAPYYMILEGAGQQNYTARALNFEVVDYVGGHPIHKPGGKPWF